MSFFLSHDRQCVIMFPYGQNDRQVQDFSDFAVQILWNPAGVYNLNSNACPGGYPVPADMIYMEVINVY